MRFNRPTPPCATNRIGGEAARSALVPVTSPEHYPRVSKQSHGSHTSPVGQEKSCGPLTLLPPTVSGDLMVDAEQATPGIPSRNHRSRSMISSILRIDDNHRSNDDYHRYLSGTCGVVFKNIHIVSRSNSSAYLILFGPPEQHYHTATQFVGPSCGDLPPSNPAPLFPVLYRYRPYQERYF